MVKFENIEIVNRVNNYRKALIERQESKVWAKGHFLALGKFFTDNANNIEISDLLKYFAGSVRIKGTALDKKDYESKIEFSTEPMTKLEKIEWENLQDKVARAREQLIDIIGEKDYKKLVESENTITISNDIKEKLKIDTNVIKPKEFEYEYLDLLTTKEELENIGGTYFVVDENVDNLGRHIIEVNGQQYIVKPDVRTFIEYVIRAYGNKPFNFNLAIDEIRDGRGSMKDVAGDTLNARKVTDIGRIFSNPYLIELRKEILPRVSNGVYRCTIKHTPKILT